MIEDYVGKVINGDCIEVMAKMPESSVDLIVTSPPYGVGVRTVFFNLGSPSTCIFFIIFLI